MTGSLVVRRPREGEAAQLAQVHITAWKQAYQGLLPDRFWNDQALAGRIQMWSNVLADQGYRSNARVAEVDGETAGIAMTGQADDADVEVELYLIYLLAEHYGSGAAEALLTELVGERSASLWVFRNNPRARSFYEKHGFRADGAERDLGEEQNDDDLRGIWEIRMLRPALVRSRSVDA